MTRFLAAVAAFLTFMILGLLLAAYPSNAASTITVTDDMSHSTNENQTRQATGVPIIGSASSLTTIFKISVGQVNPGDKIRVTADATVTNDTGVTLVDGVRKVTGIGYTVGVGWILAYSAPGGTSTRIGVQCGQNVTREIRHMVLPITRQFDVPGDWPPGTEMVVALRVSAHSTKWAANGGKDVLKVEPYGQIMFDRWSAP